MYLVQLLLAAANFLLDVVVHQVGDVPHEEADVRQLQRQRLELLRQGQVALQVVLLESIRWISFGQNLRTEL
jgi:hypothetical protein